MSDSPRCRICDTPLSIRIATGWWVCPDKECLSYGKRVMRVIE